MKYLLTIAIFIIAGGFIGCAIGALFGNPSAGTGDGVGIGALAGLVYCFITRNATE